MDIDQLKIFVAVYQLQGITPVAKQFGLASSSVSRSLAALESRLETRLFQRTTRKITPTEAGETFYHQISPLIEEFDLACHSLKEVKETPVGLIRLTCSVSFGQIVLLPILKEFQQRYPEIEIELTLSDQNNDFIDDRIDLAIRHGKLNDSTLVARKLMNTHYCVVASPSYLQSTPEIKIPKDIAKHSTISFSMPGMNTDWYFKKDAQKEKITLTSKLKISNANAIRQCAREGLGLALLANWTVLEDIQSGDLIEVLQDWTPVGESLGNTIWLVLPSKSFVPRKVKVLSNYLIEYIETFPRKSIKPVKSETSR